jgi:Tol biopolymer transport system component
MTCKTFGWRLLILICALFPLLPADGSAQYFGQNKVRYESHEFIVLQTPHFDIHYYDEEQDIVQEFGRMAERWYARLSRILGHELSLRQPIILYASSPAFRGTTAISGFIGETTGGVTEGLRRRLVMPLAGPLGESDHVLGHELVHAFQFDIASRAGPAGGSGLSAAFQLPLWFVEGMAEYLSVGAEDSQTAMWLRDAVRRQDIPAIERMDDPRYFPYRFGHGFWAFMANRFGDEVIGRTLKAAVESGSVENALRSSTGLTVEALGSEWRDALTAANDAVLRAVGNDGAAGRRVLGSETTADVGNLNLSPVLSPDGRSMVFFSERDLFSIDLYLADVETGEIRNKITKTDIDPHFDSLEFVHSAGAWSSDGVRFAFSGVSSGRPEIEIYNVQSRRVERRIRLPKLGEVPSLTWSPDNTRIAFSATRSGVTDLFILDLDTEITRQLTNDDFADLQPAWSPDGQRIVYVTDRFTSDLTSLSFGTYELGIIDVGSGAVEPVRAFATGKHINPQWSSDGGSLYFVSDRDGIANVYRLDIASGNIHQLTNLQTGVSGITSLSPAISASARATRLAYTSFEGGNYAVHLLENEELAGATPSTAVERLNAGALPPSKPEGGDVARLLDNTDFGLSPADSFTTTPYRPKLSLDYVAPPEVSIGLSSFGSLIGGGTAFQFSDLLGQHYVTTILQTTFTSEGGNLLNSLSAVGMYQNQKSRWNWGLSGGQVPYITSGFRTGLATAGGEPVLLEQEVRFWQIDRAITGSLSYPINRAQRVEFAAGFQNISFKEQIQTAAFSLRTGQLIFEESQDNPVPSSLRMGTVGAAFVYDTSISGGTSPVTGQSYRLEYGLSAGSLTYWTALGDYRRYFRVARPLTIAGRLLHYGRYGSGSEDFRLQDIFIGYPALVRGYSAGSFEIGECGASIDGSCPVFDRLLGSRLTVLNAEMRVPILGFLGVIPSKALPPVEAALFFDGGVAWRDSERPNFLGGSRSPVSSFGTSLRFNLLGFAIGQLSYVHPNDRPLKDWHWEFSFTPGF